MKQIKKQDLKIGLIYHTTSDKEASFKLISIKDSRYYFFELVSTDTYFICDENGLYSFSGEGWYREDFKFGR